MNVLITGANRGLGLEFTKQYINDGWQVIACCRNPMQAQALSKVAAGAQGRVSLETLDVSNFAQIEELAEKLKGQPIDLLINNAGIYHGGGFGAFSESDYEAWALSYKVNAMAPYKMVTALLANLTSGQFKKVATLSSKMGSIDDNSSGGSYIYRSSKTAVNMIMKSLAIDLKPHGISAITLHPGWVQTDMGGANALINAEQSVSGMRKVIQAATLDTSGSFIAYDGKPIAW